MSIEIDWLSLTPSIAESLTERLNRILSNLSRPDFIGPITIQSIEFGDIAPDVEIMDIRDVSRGFRIADNESHLSSSPECSSTRTAKAEDGHSQPSLQMHLRLSYDGNLRIRFSTALVLNHPAAEFMSLPLRAAVVGMGFDAEIILAIEGDRSKFHLSILEPPLPELPLYEDSAENSIKRTSIGARILPHLFVETEVGNADRHVLRNVGKVERFLTETTRNLICEEFLYPNTNMVALLRPISYLVERLEGGGSRPELAVELSTLEAILGEESVHCELGEEAGELSSISLLIDLHLNNTLENDDDDDDDDVQCQLRLEIPDQYPSTQEPPRVRLLAKYLGPFKVTHELLEAITNVFVNLPSSSPADSILYDGIQNAKDILSDFYLRNLHRRASSPSNKEPPTTSLTTPEHATESHDPHLESSLHNDRPDAKQVVVFSSDPIVDRKSVFIGHSVALEDPKDVPRILQHLLGDKKIAKATHNMVAWRCQFNGFLHQDNDDDGESAAGSRMAHLLNILDVKNVFVCVSRWFGGIHLGPDRFKHINQATRDALVTGGFIVSGSKLAGHQAHAASHGLVPKKKKR